MDYTAIIEELRRQAAETEAEHTRFRLKQRVLDEQMALLSALAAVGSAAVVMMALSHLLAVVEPRP